MAQCRQRFSDFSNIWRNKQLATTLKCKLYRAFILSAVLYSSETWTINKALEEKLDSFHLNCLRRILCLSYMTKITNQSVLNKTQLPVISKIIMIRRFKWFGHVQRMENDRLPRKALEWNLTEHYPNAMKAVGGQRKTWLDQLQNDCKRNNIDFPVVQVRAKSNSRSVFNKFVNKKFLV